MDYQNRAGSKKGTGGLVSDAQQNISRRQQVDNLLRDGEEVPYTFQEDTEIDSQVRRNPYIYKNHSGKLVCKLCNTMHMSWSSVERHINGKKHTLNVVRRGNLLEKHGHQAHTANNQNDEFEREVEERKSLLVNKGIIPSLKKAIVQESETNKMGVAIQVDYSDIPEEFLLKADFLCSPLIRIVSGLELSDEKNKDKKYIVIAYEPFENVAVEIPSDKEILMNKNNASRPAVDELNEKCSYWDEDSKKFFIQIFFQ